MVLSRFAACAILLLIFVLSCGEGPEDKKKAVQETSEQEKTVQIDSIIPEPEPEETEDVSSSRED